MKICHVTSAHKSNDIRIFKKECVSLAKEEENEVYLVAAGDSYDKNGVHVIGVGERKGNRLNRFFSFSRKIYNAAIRIDADIYHLHDPELLVYVKKFKHSGKKVIFDSHEYYREQILYKDYIPKLFRIFISKLYSAYENKICKWLDAVIFPCPIEGKHPFEGKVKLYEFINNTPIIDEKLNYSVENKDYNSVCCAGSLTENRGIDILIDACYKSNTKLILAGEITPEEFKTRIMEKETFSCVDYRGVCSSDEVIKIYQEAFIGASNILDVGQYSKAENLPTKVYEYMMMGMPFFISDFPYFREIINRYKCGLLVDPYNIDDIARKIEYLKNNPTEAIKMGKIGKEIVRERFNWQNEEVKLFELYNQLYNEVE